jgi:hypothetical protein
MNSLYKKKAKSTDFFFVEALLFETGQDQRIGVKEVVAHAVGQQLPRCL